MTGGTSPIGYLKAFHTNLYLSADADKVREALAEGETQTIHMHSLTHSITPTLQHSNTDTHTHRHTHSETYLKTHVLFHMSKNT